ncbi:helix-turn-helix domain-containing protein [Paenibacillus rhizoplanae]
MKPAVMIRDQLADYLTQHGLSINQFAISSGINSGTLSRIINGHQPIAMSHLELITAGMGLSEDFFTACMWRNVSIIRHRPGGGFARSL